MAYSEITYAVGEQIATITRDRAEHRNGYTITMADELADALRQAEADSDVRAIVLAANGKDFCVGMDLSAGEIPMWMSPIRSSGDPRHTSHVRLEQADDRGHPGRRGGRRRDYDPASGASSSGTAPRRLLTQSLERRS